MKFNIPVILRPANAWNSSIAAVNFSSLKKAPFSGFVGGKYPYCAR